jgi:hypothetical protein
VGANTADMSYTFVVAAMGGLLGCFAGKYSGAATRHSTFYISLTYAPPSLITMHQYFNNFMINSLFVSTVRMF